MRRLPKDCGARSIAGTAERLELPSLAAGDAAITRDVETRVTPGLEELDPLGRDLLLLQ